MLCDVYEKACPDEHGSVSAPISAWTAGVSGRVVVSLSGRACRQVKARSTYARRVIRVRHLRETSFSVHDSFEFSYP